MNFQHFPQKLRKRQVFSFGRKQSSRKMGTIFSKISYKKRAQLGFWHKNYATISFSKRIIPLPEDYLNPQQKKNNSENRKKKK